MNEYKVIIIENERQSGITVMASDAEEAEKTVKSFLDNMGADYRIVTVMDYVTFKID